jgi:hypothetical protein
MEENMSRGNLSSLVFVVAVIVSIPMAVRALPNPASVYCRDLGYGLELLQTDAGEVNACTFPDGSWCEEWSFFNGHCGNEFSYCEQNGGDLIVENGEPICVLPGGKCAERDFMEGACSALLDGGSSQDIGGGQDASGRDAGADGSTSEESSDDGCSCRLTGSGTPRLLPLWLLVLLGVSRFRRSPR